MLDFPYVCSELTFLCWLAETESNEIPNLEVSGTILHKIVDYFETRYGIEVERGEDKRMDMEGDLKAWDAKFLEGVDHTMLFALIKVRQ